MRSLVVGALLLAPVLAQSPPILPYEPPPQPGRPGGLPAVGVPGGIPRSSVATERLRILERFDLDGSGFLEAVERAAAKEHLESIGWNTRTRRGGPGPTPTDSVGAPGVPLTPEQVALHPGVPFYDTDVLRTIFIDFGLKGWESELAAFFNTDVELPATVTVDGVVYENVGVRFRGNSSYRLVSPGLRRPLRLKFDTVTQGQNVEGVRTVKLLNGVNDASNLRTVLASTIMQQYIVAPRVNFVRVVINGESWGVFQNQQHYNRDLLDDWFGDSSGVRWEIAGSPNGQGGMLYLGDDPDLYRRIYTIDNRDTPESWAALIELFRVLSLTPLDELVAALEPLLDIDAMLRYHALDVALVNSDGFWARASDYELFLDDGGRFHMIPHDINETLLWFTFPGGRGAAGTPTLHPLVGLDDAAAPLRSRLLAVPELQKRYLQYVLEIAERWLDWQNVGPLAQRYYDLIEADMVHDTRSVASYGEFTESLQGLEEFMQLRRDYLLGTVPDLIAALDVPAYLSPLR